VFIAMVLVAAIAAGVLINTAGLLQSQAEATGEESTEQVTDRVVVQSVTGTADGDGDQIEDLDIVVRRSPGSGDIDLTNAIVEVFANGESATLTADVGEGADADNFDLENIDLEDEWILSDSSDRAAIEVDIDAAAAPLEPGDSVSISITTAAGGTAFVEKRAPSSLDDDEEVRL